MPAVLPYMRPQICDMDEDSGAVTLLGSMEPRTRRAGSNAILVQLRCRAEQPREISTEKEKLAEPETLFISF